MAVWWLGPSGNPSRYMSSLVVRWLGLSVNPSLHGLLGAVWWLGSGVNPSFLCMAVKAVWWLGASVNPSLCLAVGLLVVRVKRDSQLPCGQWGCLVAWA